MVECQTTDIHSLVRYQLLQDQAVQPRVSELTSSLVASLAAEVQMQGLPMMTSSNTSPEICLGKNSYNT